MDDFFGGPKKSKAGLDFDKKMALLMFDNLIAVGNLTGAKMNQKKCHPPAQEMEILGFWYDVKNSFCKLSQKKVTKYIGRINSVLSSKYVGGKNLEKVVGNLTYAAWVSPFGRPFLSVLSSKINPLKRSTAILVTVGMRNALLIWKMILTKNKGLSFDFILGRLPREKKRVVH